MYDVAIIGSGPAGVTAAIYCARYKLNTLVLSNDVGGWVNSANVIENLPSNPAIKGKDLSKNYKEQIKNNEIDYKKETVMSMEKKEESFLIKGKKEEYEARYVIYALGTKKKMLKVPGEEKFIGNGIHTCATCDAPFYLDESVMVVGGNNSGASAALLLAEYASKVYLVELMEKLPMEPVWFQRIKNNEKIEIITGVSVKEFKGNEELSSAVMSDGSELDVKGAFIEIGSDPNTSIAKEVNVGIDKNGCIDVDASQKTTVNGFYAAGDVTNNSNNLRQIVAAQGEGAVAANSIYNEIMKK